MGQWSKFIILIAILGWIAYILFTGLNHLVSVREDVKEVVRIWQSIESEIEAND